MPGTTLETGKTGRYVLPSKEAQNTVEETDLRMSYFTMWLERRCGSGSKHILKHQTDPVCNLSFAYYFLLCHVRSKHLSEVQCPHVLKETIMVPT